jgi:hypothetical protein
MDIDVAQIRKIASEQAGKRSIEERFGPAPKLAAVDAVLLHKAASADRELLGVAVALRPDDPLAAYEEFGGTYT